MPIKKVKICGLRNRQSIEAAQDADYIGFVVGSPKSRRNLTLEQFAELKTLVRDASVVAVTVNPDPIFLHALDNLGPDIIQLHGSARTMHDALDSAISLGLDYRELNRISYPSNPSYLSVDSISQGYGGTGKSWEWKALDRSEPTEILVAGGLNPHNIHLALFLTGADGIDISSGLEINGEKSNKLIKLTIALVKNYDN